MLNLSSLILIVLISFSLQDNNCLAYFESCEEKPYQVKIENCVAGNLNEEEEEICYYCKNGFYVSDDYKKCIEVANKIANCQSYYSSYDGQIKCRECSTNYALSNDRESCIEFKNCDSLNEDGKCEECNEGYAVSYDGMSCRQFENCRKLAEGDVKCSECNVNDNGEKIYIVNSEGKCERTQCKNYDTNNVCIECFEGYYLNDDKKCEKITIENCLELDTNNKKCKSCIFEIPPDSDGKCYLPSPLIKGCIQYSSNGKCEKCYGEYEPNSNGGCDFEGCGQGNKYENCLKCKAGYYREEDENDNYICIGYDGSMDTSSSDSSSRNKVEYALIIFILSLLI